MMARKPGSRSSALAPLTAAGAALGRSSGCSPRLAMAPRSRHRRDDPDQVPGRDDVDQHAAGQCPHHEGRRAPQPQRPVIQAVARHAAERIGVRQRHHRRPQRAGDGIDEKHGERQMLGADHGKAERGRERSHDQRAAQRVALFRSTGHEGKNREPRHRGNGADDPDPPCIDADRLQPDREKRQMGADHPEGRAVEQRQPGRELPRSALRCDGDL